MGNCEGATTIESTQGPGKGPEAKCEGATKIESTQGPGTGAEMVKEIRKKEETLKKQDGNPDAWVDQALNK